MRVIYICEKCWQSIYLLIVYIIIFWHKSSKQQYELDWKVHATQDSDKRPQEYVELYVTIWANYSFKRIPNFSTNKTHKPK